jgi:hypothetical protein
MTVYTYAQMEQLWIQAAAPKLGAARAKALAPVAAAIGEAESGGNSDALNPSDNNGTQSSFGIWQISTGTHAPPSPNWANPAVNAQLAVGKYLGAGDSWSPWGTFDSGAYKAYLSPGTSPDSNVPGSPSQINAQTTAAGSLDCLVPNPFASVASIGPISVGAGPACIFTKSNARAFIGAGLMGAGVILSFDGGMFIMAGLALRAVGSLGGKAGGVLMLIPGAEGVGAALTAAGAVAKDPAAAGRKSAKQRDQADAGDVAELRSVVGEPRENPDLDVGPTVRQSPAQTRERKARESSRARARRYASPSGSGPASAAEAGF